MSETEFCRDCGEKINHLDDFIICSKCKWKWHRECYIEKHKCWFDSFKQYAKEVYSSNEFDTWDSIDDAYKNGIIKFTKERLDNTEGTVIDLVDIFKKLVELDCGGIYYFEYFNTIIEMVKDIHRIDNSRSKECIDAIFLLLKHYIETYIVSYLFEGNFEEFELFEKVIKEMI